MKDLNVRDVFDPEETFSVVVLETMPLAEAISRFAHEPRLRAVFLIDSRLRFAGVLTRRDLLRWARYRLGGSFQDDWPSATGLLRLVTAASVKDLAQGNWDTLGVKLDDSLDEALHQMTAHDETILPVLDDEGKILGDLRLSEILLKALEEGRLDGTQ